MAPRINTYTQFLPLKPGNENEVIIKNECYFSLVFLGGNYYSYGSFLQRIFGGRDDVALIAGLRLQPDGLVIMSTEEPNIVIDKRAIKPGRNVNIPMVLNLLVKIPAYMDSIGFSFKIATVNRSDNFSVALDVLNNSAHSSVLEGLAPTVVGKSLAIGKVVKDMFDKLDAANNRNLIQLAVNDFLVPVSGMASDSNTILQEGYLVVFVKDESEQNEEEDDFEVASAVSYVLTTKDGKEKVVREEEAVFLDVAELEKESTQEVGPQGMSKLSYDEANNVLKLNGKIVTNTYLVLKIQKDAQRGENLNAVWSKKFNAAVQLLTNEFSKTTDKLKDLQPRITQLLNEAMESMLQDASFTPFEKDLIKEKYRSRIDAETAKFK